jgi:chromosome segregation ATPase
MASSTQIVPTTDFAEMLPEVQLDVRQGGARPVRYALDGIDFLVGSVPGCDLRVGADTAAVLCLIARHPAGVVLRKLAPKHSVLVNGQAAYQRDLVDGDRIQVGSLDLQIHITPAVYSARADQQQGSLDKAKQDFHQSVMQFRKQLLQFQEEKAAFEQANADPRAVSGEWKAQRDTLIRELREREMLLVELEARIESQKEELDTVRRDMADARRQHYDHYQERRDRLTAQQAEFENARADLAERERKLRLEEEDAAGGRQRDRKRLEEIERREAHFEQQILRNDAERGKFEAEQQEWARKEADLAEREGALVETKRSLDARVKQYEADVLRLNRLQGDLEQRAVELGAQVEEATGQRDQLQRDSAELHNQLERLDEWRVKLQADAERLETQKDDQDVQARQLAERAASLEGQQSTLAILRGRLERTRDELRVQESELDGQRARHDTRDTELTRREQELNSRQRDFEADKEQYLRDHAQWVERSAVMDAAVRQLGEAQDRFTLEEERLRREAAELEDLRRQHVDAEAILQGRLGQLAETRERIDLERQALQQRSINITQREQACATLQEQLHQRSAELAERNKEIDARLEEHQVKLGELDDRARQLDERDRDLKVQIETWRCEQEQAANTLQQRHLQLACLDDQQQQQLNQVALARKAHNEERAAFHVEQQTALDKLAAARAELEALRQDALAFIQQLPDAELRAGTAVDRLGHARQQLHNHLDEIHKYVRQCQDELEQLRSRLQADLDKLDAHDQTLRRSQDEHRLAMTAFRQQLIDWQGQIADLKRLLARDSTRLERREAKADERAKEMEAASQRLAQHAEELEEQARDVADRREEIDGHLVDMRQWYRHKLRELAGIPLIPDTLHFEGEPTILPVNQEAVGSGQEAVGSGQVGEEHGSDEGIVPTGRSILSISTGADQGDQKLGQVLRTAQLIDADTLSALLAEARRQRRSLRQVLLSSGVITLYQLALIEAGNVDGLMLGPVRIVDRLRHTNHETVYRVFDPRRGVEAVLRHLAEADMTDAVKPDEFRQRFTEAMLNDPHLANTLEVMELSGRPAAEQEWLTGLPATDWPPLAAAPGVCYRLLTQAAQGLATAHQAGVVHGHLTDSLLLLTADGILKICGIGEPPWLAGVQYDDEPTPRDDLRTLGKIAASWCTPSGVRKGPKTKPLPDALVSILFRLAAEKDAGYPGVAELLADLQKAADAIPPNAEAWDRLLKYVREHGTAEMLLRQSA